MVRIPLPSESQRPVGQNGYAAPSGAIGLPPAGAQAEQLGGALVQAGLGVSSAAARLVEVQNLAAVKEAQALAEERIVAADLAYTARIGKDATGAARADATKGLADQITTIEGGLSSEDQRTAFRRVMNQRMLGVRARWEGHEIEQTRVWDIGARKASLESKKALARRQGPAPVLEVSGAFGGGSPNAPDAPRDPLAPVKMEAANLAGVLGYGPEQTEQMVLEATSEVHAGIIQDLAESGRGAEARSYLAQHDGEMHPDAVGKMRGVVQRASVGEEAAGLAVQVRDELLAERKATGPLAGWTVPLTAQDLQNDGSARVQGLFEQGKISVEVRDAALAEIGSLAKRMHAEEVATADGTAREAEQWLIDNPLASVSSLPPTLYERARSQGLLGDLNAFSGSARRYSTDAGLLSDLLRPRGAGWFDRPLEEFVTTLRRRLGPQDLRMAVAMWRDANQQADAEDFSLLTPLRRTEDFAKRLKIDPQKNPEEFDRLRREVEARVNARGLKPAEVPSHLDEILGEIETDRAFRPESFVFDFLNPDPAVPFALLPPEEQPEAYVIVGRERVRLGDIPSSYTALVLEEIETENQRRATLGLPPLTATKQRIAELWVATRGQRR